MLFLADIYHEVVRLRRSAYYHALVNRRARADEQLAALLSVVQTVGNSLARFKSYQRTGRAACDVALVRLILVEYRAHDALALGIGEEFASVTEKSAAGDEKFYSHAVADRGHLRKLALARTQLFHYRAYATLGNVDNKALDRLAELAVYFFIKHAGGGNCQLVALAAHIFDQYRKVHLTSARYAEAVGRVGLGNSQRNVFQQLFEKSVAKLA